MWLKKVKFFSCNSFGFLLGHHHLAELVKVHGARSVLVDFLDDAVEVVGGQPGVELGDDLAELAGGDEAGAVAIVHPEGLLQLGLHRLLVGLLDEELGAELAELPELDLAGAVLVDLLEDLLELLLGGSEAHGAEDVVEVVGGEEVLLLDVEEVEAELEDLDLVLLEGGRLGDLVEVDVGELVLVGGLGGHVDGEWVVLVEEEDERELISSGVISGVAFNDLE